MRAVTLTLLLATAAALVGGVDAFHIHHQHQLHTFVPPTYNRTVVDAFTSKVLLNPSNISTTNPYSDPNYNTSNPDTICAVQYPNINNRSTYYLRNFTSPAAAEAAGAFVTHLHPCGLCSTTQDLAIYMNYSDLTNPVRDCAIKSIISDQWALQCLMDIGFTAGCSQIWLQDAMNTRQHCLDICLQAWMEKWPNNIPANSTNLNPCIACDENISGPIFKVVAGRTRRASGLKSSINRPADQIYPITHYYY
eukprot:GFYU01016339.1.p1 GENE.GFYU01016339.1~~GFYU01016339.1.p1  ORF type:complete len:250 (-),score=37.89 GFYU01016339.1:401-1150(-)